MTNLYEKITDTLVDDRYIIIDKALPLKLSQYLLLFAKTQNSYKKSGISSSSNLYFDRERMRDKTLWLDEDNGIQSEYLSWMNGLKEYLNCSLYLGLSYFETHFSIYEKGDFYEKHLDAFKNSKNRVVTVVYYLVFMSEKFPHEVLSTYTTRYSIAGWFRIDDEIY